MSSRTPKNCVGWIYLITSPAFEGWTKVGLTSVSLEKRLSAYHTSSPFRCHEIISSYEVRGSKARLREAEKCAFACLKDHLSPSMIRNEWVNLTPEQVDVLIRGELEEFFDEPPVPTINISISGVPLPTTPAPI